MNKITQKQIRDTAEKHAAGMFSGGTYSASEIFEKAIKWYRMAELETNEEKAHPDNPNLAELTSSDTIKIAVDNWPEILEFLRVYHSHRYDIYGDAITIFCRDKKERKGMEAVIEIIGSIKG